MAFTLYKGDSTSTVEMVQLLPTEAIAIGDPVYIVAAASAAASVRCSRIAGSYDNANPVYGIAAEAATAASVSAGTLISVIVVKPFQTWICDSAANSDATNVAVQDNIYLAAKGTAGAAGTYAITISSQTISVYGHMVEILGIYGAVADKKYLVRIPAPSIYGGTQYAA